MNELITIIQGDAIEKLRELQDESAQCCITSPPYWGLRDYGATGQIGLEDTPDFYVAKIVDVFREVRRVLKNDGTLWLNLGDSYAGSHTTYNGEQSKWQHGEYPGRLEVGRVLGGVGLKAKDLCGIPWRVAFALQADGWYLRSDIIWHKPNPMPESVTDRPTKAHEYLFLLSKQERYVYDADAIREENSETSQTGGIYRNSWKQEQIGHGSNSSQMRIGVPIPRNGRNKRSVWTVATAPYAEAHFATYPPDLIKPCILAGTKAGDTVLDPFAGSGTTGMVAIELGRKAILIELNSEYLPLIEQRCSITPGLAF